MYTFAKKSSSGHIVVKTDIYFAPSSAKTLASLILMNKEYALQDEDFLKSMEYTYKKINFSRETLSEWQNKIGNLFCVYCKKQDLIIELEGMSVSNNIKATIDHVVPISEGGDVFNIENVVCACGKCNTKKGSKSLDDYLKSINLSKEEFNKRLDKYKK